MSEKQPRLGVAALVTNQGLREHLLLWKSKKIEGRSRWVIPGGGLLHGESFADCAWREVFEETGIEIEVSEAVEPSVYQILNGDDHRVIVTVDASPVGSLPKPKASDDLEEAGWFTREQILAGEPDLTEFTKRVLREQGWLL